MIPVMTIGRRIKDWKIHESQRGYFGFELYKQMAENPNIWLLVGDLGYKLFDAHFQDFPERTYNCGAAEQAMIGIAVGLALEGKIVFAYSISTFLIYRPLEVIRNYLNREKIPVHLVGSGVGKSYLHDGFSHWADDLPELLSCFKNIQQYFPQTNEDTILSLREMLQSDKPSFIGLKR